MSDLACNYVSERLIKPDQVRIRITEGDGDLLDRLGNNVLSRADVSSYILHAAIEAINENGGIAEMPPKFKIINESLCPNEETTKYKSKK